MGFFGFVGRLAFAFIFMSGGLQKLQTFEQTTGGPIVVNGVTPAMERFFSVSSALIEKPINFDEIKVRSCCLSDPSPFPCTPFNQQLPF
jgi:hypothetical protein